MSRQAVARRYARALFELGQENRSLEALEQEFNLVVTTISGNAELNELIQNHQVPPAAKQKVLKNLFASRVSATMANFIMLVLEKRRAGYLPEMLEAYRALANEARGIWQGEVLSAVEPAPRTLDELKKALGKISGKEIRLNYRVDPNLKGGLIVRINDTIYDGSVASRLNSLQEHLRHADFLTRQG